MKTRVLQWKQQLLVKTKTQTKRSWSNFVICTYLQCCHGKRTASWIFLSWVDWMEITFSNYFTTLKGFIFNHQLGFCTVCTSHTKTSVILGLFLHLGYEDDHSRFICAHSSPDLCDFQFYFWIFFQDFWGERWSKTDYRELRLRREIQDWRESTKAEEAHIKISKE